MKKTEIRNPSMTKASLITEAFEQLKDMDSLQINNGDLLNIKQHNIDLTTMADDMIELFPVIEIIMETITSLILTPNDMVTENLNYSLGKIRIPAELKATFLSTTEEYCTSNYNILDKLDTIVKESLYSRGSYIELNIPSTYIRNLMKNINKDGITAGIEHYISDKETTPLGIKNREETDENTGITLTTDYNKLLNPDLITKQVTVGIEESLYGTKFDNLTVALESAFTSDTEFTGTVSDDIFNDDGKPIIKKIESFNVVPITSKSNPSKHEWYFIILDNDGNDVRRSKKFNLFSNEDEGTNTVENSKDLLSKLNNKLHGTGNTPQISNIDDLRKILLVDKVTAFIKDLDKRTIINEDIDIPDELVLSVADYVLNKSGVKIMFLPSEMVSYYAVNFRSNGTGRSLLERVSMLVSIRSILLFTNLLAYVKSSITTTEIAIDLDPDDANYRETLASIVAEVMKNRRINLPFGMVDTNSFIDWVHKLGFSVKAKHPGFPDINIDVTEKKNDISPIDTELTETMDREIMTSLYVTPEMLDEEKGADLATTVRNNRAILNKRINRLQKKYSTLVTTDMVKKLSLDGKYKEIIKRIVANNLSATRKMLIKDDNNYNTEIIKKASDEDLINQITMMLIKRLNVALPTVEAVEETNTTLMLTNYNEMLDTVLDNVFSSDLITSDIAGDLSDNLDVVKQAFKTSLMRKYMADNKILPEFNEMFILDEDGKPNDTMLTEFTNFISTLGDLTIPFIKSNNKVKEGINKKISKIDDEVEEHEEDVLVEDDIEEEPTEEPVIDDTPTEDEIK